MKMITSARGRIRPFGEPITNYRLPYFLYFPIIILFLCASCSPKIHQKAGTNAIVIFPSPPDTARIQFLTKISTSADLAGIIKKRRSFAKFLLGEDKQTVSIVKPYGMAIHKSKIYVVDTYVGGLEIINLEKGSMEYFTPTGKGQLKQPVNCFVDENGFLYVADAGRFQIVVFDDKGNYINSFGEAEKFKPTDVFIHKDKIWVANMTGQKINVYSKDSVNKLLYSFPKSELGSHDYLYSPQNIFVNNDKVYVTDAGDFKIKTYTHDGKFLDTLGTQGDRYGQFARPKGIAVDRESNLYVVDAAFENVQIFNKEGQLLMFFGGKYTGPGYMWLPAKVIIDYDNLSYFQKFVDPGYELKYLLLVTNQYGPDKINVYGHVEPAKPGAKGNGNGNGKEAEKEN